MYRRALDVDPNHVTTLCRLGVLLQSVKKDYDGAERIYKRVLDIEPEHVGILYNYGCLLEDVRKDYDSAEEMYRRVLDVDPDHVSALRVYGRLLHQVKNDSIRAEEIYQHVLRLEPFDLSTLNRYGVLLHQDKEDYDGAEECFKKVLNADPNHFRTLGNYAVFLKNIRKDYVKADELYQRALAIDPTHVPTLNNYAVFIKQSRAITPERDNVESATVDQEEKAMEPEKLYLFALQKNPHDEMIHYKYAKWLKDVAKDNLKAIEHFLKSLPQVREHEVMRPLEEIEREIEILNTLGMLYQCEDCIDLNEAEGCFQMALGMNRNHIGTLYNYAKFLEFRASTQYDDCVRATDFEEAESVFLNILQLDENHIDSLYSYGILCEHFRLDHDKCEEMHKKILSIDPNHVDTLLHYGIFLHEVRKDDKAAEEKYNLVLELDPNHVAVTYNYACLLADSGDKDRAENLYKKVLDINPEHVPTLTTYGAYLHEEKGLDTQAEEFYLRALEVDPNHISTLYNIACLMKDWATSMKNDVSRYALRSQLYFERLLALDPDNINGLLNYGVLLFECHDLLAFTYQKITDDGNLETVCVEGSGYMGAELCFQRVLELDPNNVRALFNFSGMLYSMLPRIGIHIEIPTLVRDKMMEAGKTMVQKLVDMPSEDVGEKRLLNSKKLLQSFKIYEKMIGATERIPDYTETAGPLAESIMGLITPIQDAEAIRLRKEEREAKEAATEAALMLARNAKMSEETKKIKEEKAHKAMKLRVMDVMTRYILNVTEEQVSGAFNAWKTSTREMKLAEIQELLDSKSNHLHEQESKQSPFFRAKAAFDLSEKYRRKRDKVVAEVRKSTHRIGHHVKMTEYAMHLKYKIPNHLENYEVMADGSPSPMAEALKLARLAFEYSENKREERTLDEESLRKKREEDFNILRYEVKRICEENESALLDEEQHMELCDSLKNSLRLDSDGEEVMYHALISFSPDNPFSRASYGIYLFKKGIFKEAKEEFEKSISVFEASGGVHADSHYYYGVILAAQGKVEEAEVHFKKVLSVDAFHADCLCDYGIILRSFGSLELAEVRFKECLEANPNHLKCLRNYATFMREMDESKNPDKWVDTCDLLARIISLSPNDTDILLQYALLVNKKLNMPDNAKMAYEMLLDTEPQNQEALIQYSYMLYRQLPPVSDKLELPKKIVDITDQIRSQLSTLRSLDDVKQEFIETADKIEEKLEKYRSDLNSKQENKAEASSTSCCFLF